MVVWMIFRHAKNCYYCGVAVFHYKLPPGTPASKYPKNLRTRDHKIPVVRGGTNALSNLVTACYDCNICKGRLSEQEWRVVLNYRRGIQTVVRCSLKKHIQGAVKFWIKGLVARLRGIPGSVSGSLSKRLGLRMEKNPQPLAE